MDEQDEATYSSGGAEARFRIKTPAGEVEVIGPEGFVERRWSDVQSALVRIGDRVPSGSPELEAPNKEAESAQTPKRAALRKRGGPSCASRIIVIKESGFFSAARKASEVVDKLTELATPYEAKHVAAALNHLTKTGRLRRIKDGDGDWNYVNP